MNKMGTETIRVTIERLTRPQEKVSIRESNKLAKFLGIKAGSRNSPLTGIDAAHIVKGNMGHVDSSIPASYGGMCRVLQTGATCDGAKDPELFYSRCQTDNEGCYDCPHIEGGGK